MTRTKQVEVVEATAEAAEASKVIEAGDRARAQTSTKEEATLPSKEDTSHRRLPKGAAGTRASRAKTPDTTKSRQ